MVRAGQNDEATRHAHAARRVVVSWAVLAFLATCVSGCGDSSDGGSDDDDSDDDADNAGNDGGEGAFGNASAVTGSSAAFQYHGKVQQGRRVDVYASVRNDEGAAIGGLMRGAFVAEENGVNPGPEAIADVTQGEPVDLALVIDVTESVVSSGLLDAIKSSARALVDASPAGTVFAVYRFAERVDAVGAATNDRLQAKRRIEEVSAFDVETGGRFCNLYGAMSWVAVDLAANARRQASPRPRVMVLVTDGRDNLADVTAEAVASGLAATDTAVFAVGIGTDVSPEVLRAFSPYGGATMLDDGGGLGEAFNAIGETLSQAYRIRFQSPSREGSHTVTLKVAANGGERSFSFNFTLQESDPCGLRNCSTDGACGVCRDGYVCGEPQGVCAASGYSELLLNEKLGTRLLRGSDEVRYWFRAEAGVTYELEGEGGNVGRFSVYAPDNATLIRDSDFTAPISFTASVSATHFVRLYSSAGASDVAVTLRALATSDAP